ncbi:hypothetical protein [Larkinella ripae]
MSELTKSTSEITMSQGAELTDPKLRAIAQRIIREAELAIEKVAANHTQAKKYPIDAKPGSFESALKARFDSMPQAKKQVASTKAIERLKAPAVVRAKHFGDLATVDLSSTQSVDEQVRAIDFPDALAFTAREVANFTQKQENGQPAAAATSTTDKLEFRIHKVKCLDETSDFLGGESGDDEVDCTYIAVDEDGEVKKGTSFRVRSDFDDGEQQVYSPPRRLTYFNLQEGKAFPKTYYVTLILSEADMGGISDFTNKLLDLIETKVKAAIIAAGFPVGGLLGAVIGAAVGYIVSRVFDLIINIWSDDPFTPKPVSVTIPSLTARWSGSTNSPDMILTFSGYGGTYQVTCDWQLFS